MYRFQKIYVDDKVCCIFEGAQKLVWNREELFLGQTKFSSPINIRRKKCLALFIVMIYLRTLRPSKTMKHQQRT